MQNGSSRILKHPCLDPSGHVTNPSNVRFSIRIKRLGRSSASRHGLCWGRRIRVLMQWSERYPGIPPLKAALSGEARCW